MAEARKIAAALKERVPVGNARVRQVLGSCQFADELTMIIDVLRAIVKACATPEQIALACPRL